VSTPFLFYRCDAPADPRGDGRLSSAYSWRLWTPRAGGLLPDGLPVFPFGLWTAMHHLRVFANGDYGVLVVYHAGRIVHRSGLFPRYARFPFMTKEDLQIGDVWTDPDHRSHGLASFALQELVRAKAGQGRRIWYVVEPGNAASIRTVEKAGFTLVGQGARTKRFGLSLLGQFVMAPGRTPA
jgi:RimJ/RimL family protein N-acetyltransferase